MVQLGNLQHPDIPLNYILFTNDLQITVVSDLRKVISK